MNMTDIDLSPLRQHLSQYAGHGQTMLLPSLHQTQDLYGFIPESAAIEIAKTLKVPLADIYGVISFYTLFREKPVSKQIIHVCNDAACSLAGSEAVFKLQRISPDGDQTILEQVPCLGLCDLAPSSLVFDSNNLSGTVSVSGVNLHTGRIHRSHIYSELEHLTRNCGKGKTTNISEYLVSGGYSGLKRAYQMTRQDVIEEVKKSGLVGRGGAAFPTGQKWEGAAKAPGIIKYIVCNADEAEPGTFKDRVIMEDDPHRILEGILIAAYAIGATKGYMYIRGEYVEPYQIMKQTIEEAGQWGILNLPDESGKQFDLELRRGAGAYVCGEETALFESIEGKRGFPRVKPPFPVTAGLFGQPTVINNVETLSNVPFILAHGSEKYRSIGTEKSPGSKLFCLSGDITKPGLYEVPFGVTIKHLIELAGGMKGEKNMQAALFGGAAGAFATTKDLDVKLSFEDLREAGIPLGAGVVTVFDESRDLRQVILRIAHFFAEESCGKCFPCQLGTRRQVEILERVSTGNALPDDVDRLRDIGKTMTDASICGLGQTAPSAVLSAINHFPELFTNNLVQ
jgi:NADH-quinone oxidoreductase subunit F